MQGDSVNRIPIAHIDDDASIDRLLHALCDLHGDRYQFSLLRWEEAKTIRSIPGCVTYCFAIRTTEATISLRPNDRVYGALDSATCDMDDDGVGHITTDKIEALWPGDVIAVGPSAADFVNASGSGVAFCVTAEESGYRPPRLALLRGLADKPGGCAAYPGAFRREACPPDRTGASESDARGLNRVNEHTLDMRFDRNPPPIRHYHGPVTAGADGIVSHSEIAIVLPRGVYGLSEVDRVDQGHLLIYRDPRNDPTDIERIDVTPGSIVVTPASADIVLGHCFENVFAMLLAIPGFVAPYHMLD